MKTIKEIWKDIPNYEGLYQASNMGRIRSLDRYSNNRFKDVLRKGRILKPRYTKKGYVTYALWNKEHIRKDFKGHTLVLKTFIKDGFENECINHKNGIKDDNRLFNLEYCTMKQNVNHALENNLFKNRKRRYKFNKKKYTEEELQKLRKNFLDEHRDIAIKSAKEKNEKKIYQYDLRGNFIKEWKSTREAEKYYGKRIHLEHKTSLGYKWKKEMVL